MNIFEEKTDSELLSYFSDYQKLCSLDKYTGFQNPDFTAILKSIGRSSALLVKESLVTTSLKLFSIVGKRPYITTNLHSYGMKCPPDREDLRILSTRRAFFLLTSLFLCGYAPYFSNALRITSSQLNSTFIV